MKQVQLLDYVVKKLAENRGKWREISDKTEVPYHTIAKISSGAIRDPGVRKIESLANYFNEASSCSGANDQRSAATS